MLEKEDVHIDAIFMCPHHPIGTPECEENFLIQDCECRKPKPGLLKKAVEKFKVDISQSYFVGDLPVDVLAGKSARVKTVLINNHILPDTLINQKPDLIVKNLLEFVEYLKKQGN